MGCKSESIRRGELGRKGQAAVDVGGGGVIVALSEGLSVVSFEG